VSDGYNASTHVGYHRRLARLECLDCTIVMSSNNFGLVRTSIAQSAGIEALRDLRAILCAG